MKKFTNQAIGIYYENDKEITIKSNIVTAILKENYYTVSIFYIKNCHQNKIMNIKL